MHPFEVTMIVSSTSLVLITVLFLVIRTMPSRRGIGWWTSASALQSIAYVLQMLFHDQEKTVAGDLTFFVLQTTVNHLLVIGTMLFVGEKINFRLWFTVPSTMLLAAAALSLYGQPFLSVLLFATENAAAFILLAYSIYKIRNKVNKSTKMAGLLCFIVGVHWLDFPFLGHLEAFATIGFILGITLAIGIFLSLSAMALLQFREHTKRSEERAIYSANHDPLTGLYNRSSLDKLYDEYVEEAEKNNLCFIVLYLDLDGFKAVNDKFGHKAGDMLLITVAKRLEKWLGDKGDAIRIGGDEIIVLSRLRGTYSEQSAYKSARLLLDMIELPIVDGKDIHNISSSIGGCSYQPGIITPTLDEMIQCADDHMYKSKQAGGHCIFLKESNDLTPETKSLIKPQLPFGLKRKKRVAKQLELV